MRKILLFFTLFIYALLFSQNKSSQNNEFNFYENKGQIVDQDGKNNIDVKYLYHSAGLNVQLRSNGFSYDIYETKKSPNPNSSKNNKNKIPNGNDYHLDEFIYEKSFHRIDIELLNSNKNSKIIVEGKSPDFDNYYNIPNKPKGITNVHRFQKVLYKNIYPNIDLVFFKPKDTLKPIEYNFIINQGGRVSDIKMKFNGAAASIRDGKLAMNVRFGEIHENIPNSWIEGIRKENINVSFKDLGDQTFGFNSPVDSSNKIIVIDPVPTRIWGSYAGGYGEEYGKIKTDNQNKPYLYGGTTSSSNIATTGAHQQNLIGQMDAFVMKLTKDGQRLWSTYYGSPKNDFFNDVDFDENYNIYLGGSSEKTLTRDALLVKLNSNGNLIFFKDFGGTNIDECFTVSYNQNHIYIGGETMSTNFPILNAAYPSKPSGAGYFDGFLIDLDNSGNVQWATFFGGTSGSTSIYNIFSSTDNLEVIGASQSTTIPMINPFQGTHAGVSDGLYLKFSKAGTLLRSSYFGEAGQETIREARIINNTLVLAGEFMTFNPTGGAIRKPGVWKVNLNTNVIDKTYLPFIYEMQLSAYIDTTGNIFYGGLSYLNQTGLATPNAYMTTTGPYIKSFLVKYNSNNIKEWGTFYGGNGGTQLGYTTKDNEGYIYFTGMSSNNTTGIATPGTFQQQGGHPSNDIFIVKFQDCTSSGMVTSNSPVCINSTIQLNATGGTTYNWTGPNGFTSNIQNPTIPNAIATNAGTYTCQVSGSGACDGSFTVNVIVGDTVAPVPNIPTLTDITGDCHTVISTFPTANDNCAGLITATTTDPLSYSLPGTYVIHWNYNDGNGNTATQNQNVIIAAPALPTTANTTQTFCATNQPKISDIQITGQNIKWYDAANTILPITTPLVNGQTYYASQTINGCESGKIAIQITVNNTPRPIANATQDFCASANPTLSNLVITGTSLTFYSATGTILPNTTPLVHGQTYFVTQTLNACESEKLAIAVTLSTNNVPAIDFSDTLCNTTIANTMIVNLHSYENNIINNPNNYIFTYTDNTGNIIANPSNYTLNIGTTIIYVKVSTPDGCFNIIRLNITLNPKPKINLPETIEFCKGKTITLDAGSGFTSYLWNTGATTQTIIVSTPGKYSVKVTNNFGCENTDNVQVSYSVLAEIVSVNISNNTATVVLSATGNYEYSLDNFTWQDSNVFNNLNMGEYTAYVRTKAGCIIGEKNFSIFNIPNAISPNGDGKNDKWKIAGLENYPKTEVNVYDRRGFLVFNEITIKKAFEWDGKLNETPLATGNYWYTIKVSDGRIYTGWLLIKNRE
ncbi:DUF7948 domain-containing protein [Chryseobacterium polytrichastri]|uniref:Gliding motility-associated C-terminal domain-containing protein n=1 Tax=Chryseobacterium polytrichastri TaxID=1302687 RepID=A0A1M6S459_9FLAO|nr:T9SS type B sorting domain-containing protein [Chryseobacterium polytrichastri]SHK39476.1 gliding motility-associated C-terminal domain-containing protein [Chryseobacterium polytrichastri]